LLDRSLPYISKFKKYNIISGIAEKNRIIKKKSPHPKAGTNRRVQGLDDHSPLGLDWKHY
jgi:hypothetical protein